MARTIIKIQYSQPFQTVDETAKNILLSNGYKEIDYNNESVWKKGTGMMTAMQFIKIEYEENVLLVSGWVQVGMGNVGGNEMALTGFTASIPKKSVMKVISKIQDTVR